MSNEIITVSIDVLKIHPRNAEFFDDISGDAYENFKASIKEDGIISEIIVAPDMTIISGHQRYKAAKELGIPMVPIRVREDLVDEDKKLKVLLAANFQRPQNDEAKQRKIAVEYVRLCGYKNGEMGNGREKECQNGTPKMTLDEIASQLGTSKRNLQRALSIERNLTESMKELLDTGVISKTLASDLIASLSEEEQEELISKLDATKKYTAAQIQGYIDENARLKEKLAEPTPVEVKVVDNPEQTEKIERLEKRMKDKLHDYDVLFKDYSVALKEKNNLEKKVKKLEELNEQTPQAQYQKKICDAALVFAARVSTFIKEVGGYVWLSDKINELPEYEKRGYLAAIQALKDWVDVMQYNINKTKGDF